jgi:hypothetical protein
LYKKICNKQSVIWYRKANKDYISLKFTFTGPKAGEYLTHRVVPGRGTGAELADITYEVLTEYESLETLQVYVWCLPVSSPPIKFNW